ncbi:MAG: IS1182 family transposase [Anaerolineae bacterium]
MKTKKESLPVFKPYIRGQLRLLPINLDELVPESHLVRVIDQTVDQLDLSLLLAKYKGGGTSAFHPVMMLKVLLYAFSQRIYTSRRIAKALREDINFIWLSGNNYPDFRTINDFRSSRMKYLMEQIFAMVVELLMAQGQITLQHYFMDGTKIEANASKSKVIWAKRRDNYAKLARQKTHQMLKEAERANQSEQAEYGDHDLEEVGEDSTPLSAEELKARIDKLNEELRQTEGEPPPKKKRAAVKKLEQECLPKLIKYEEQARLLDGRKSCAVADPDATCMMMKEDRGALKPWPKPAYNVQMGTEGQYIVGYSVHQRTGDTSNFIPHLETLREGLGRLPDNIIADAGYGCEENYAYLEEHNLGNYVKYNTFYQDTRARRKTTILRNNRFDISNFKHDEILDEYICPANRRLRFERTTMHTTLSGYTSERAVYVCENCADCQHKSQCTKAFGNRETHISHKLQAYRQQARDNLMSDEGRVLRAKRSVEVESVFGHLKHNLGLRRFILRGLEKVKIELGLVAIAYNLRKLAVT